MSHGQPPPMPRPSSLTHYCDWDAIGRHSVKALCGVYIRRTDHTNEPTCPQCQAGLAYRAQLEARVQS